MAINTTVSIEKPLSRLFVPALAFAYFASSVSSTIIAFLAVDIATTFFESTSGASIGVTSQLNTVNAIAIVVFSISLSFLAVRFKHKPLFLAGTFFVLVSAAGSFLAPSFLALNFFYAMEGAGSILVWTMAVILIGDYLQPEKKAKAISLLLSISGLATLVTILLVGYITDIGGWRANFLFLVLPFSAIALVLSSIILQSEPIKKSKVRQENPYVEGFKKVLTNKSATSCLIVNLLTVVSGQVALFALAFYRIRFSLPREWTMAIVEIAAVIMLTAPLVSSRIVNRIGAKRLSVSSISIAAICLLLVFFVPNLYVAVILDMAHLFFGAISIPAFVYLALEQVPNHRSTMMALSSLFNNLGNVLAPLIGGSMLALTSGFYGSIGIVFAGMTIIGAAILLLFVRDTTKTKL
jgi:predicted MFS family arabinose efflux permease